MAKSSGKEEPEPNPKPERAEFDRVLKSLLNTPPSSREQIQKQRKRKKKLGKVLDEDVVNR